MRLIIRNSTLVEIEFTEKTDIEIQVSDCRDVVVKAPKKIAILTPLTKDKGE